MIYNLEKMMCDIVKNWDSSIFFYGGDTSSAGYTEEQYKLLGYVDKREFTLDAFFREFNFYNRIKGTDSDIGIGQILNKADKDVLIEHGQSLFDNIKEKDKIYRYMLGLALYLNRYRYLKTRDTTMNKLNTIGREYPRKNYLKKEKEKKLKKLAEEMILLMGGHNVVREGITNELKKIIKCPSAYILENKYKISTPKKTIEAYLVKLKLKKSIEIKNFIEDIK